MSGDRVDGVEERGAHLFCGVTVGKMQQLEIEGLSFGQGADGRLVLVTRNQIAFRKTEVDP